MNGKKWHSRVGDTHSGPVCRLVDDSPYDLFFPCRLFWLPAWPAQSALAAPMVYLAILSVGVALRRPEFVEKVTGLTPWLS